jgi:hypothetical protein
MASLRIGACASGGKGLVREHREIVAITELWQGLVGGTWPIRAPRVSGERWTRQIPMKPNMEDGIELLRTANDSRGVEVDRIEKEKNSWANYHT